MGKVIGDGALISKLWTSLLILRIKEKDLAP